jgi:hypothetical protein
MIGENRPDARREPIVERYVSGAHSGVQRGAAGNREIGLGLKRGRATQQVLNVALHAGHARGAADQQHLVQVSSEHSCSAQRRATRRCQALQQGRVGCVRLFGADDDGGRRARDY